MSELQKIRIKLKAYDHALLDLSAGKLLRQPRRQAPMFRPYTSSYREGSNHNS